MHAMCPLSCPSTSNQRGWKLTSGGAVQTPAGDCLDTAGQLPSIGSGLNWLRTAPCAPGSETQHFTYVNNSIRAADGRCLGVESHWLWPQPMVSLMGCGGAHSTLTLHTNGTMTSATGYGCFGVSTSAGPPSSLWRKPMPGGKTAVLAINSAALPHNLTIDVAHVLKADADAGLAVPANATITDIWSGKALGTAGSYTREVPPHGNIFITLE